MTNTDMFGTVEPTRRQRAARKARDTRRVRAAFPGFDETHATTDFYHFGDDCGVLAAVLVVTRDEANKMLRTFGSVGGVLAASINRLAELGLDETMIRRIRAMHATVARVLRGSIAQRDVLSSWSSVVDYLRCKIAFNPIEEFHILFLDKQNQLISDERQQVGTVDHTPVYPREVIKRALELGSTAIILAHNHPSGNPSPSRADIDMTKAIMDAAKPLGIALHDHIIVGREGHASLKGLKLI